MANDVNIFAFLILQSFNVSEIKKELKLLRVRTHLNEKKNMQFLNIKS